VKPRETLPNIDHTTTPTWWSGFWTAAPVWMAVGMGLGVMLAKG